MAKPKINLSNLLDEIIYALLRTYGVDILRRGRVNLSNLLSKNLLKAEVFGIM